MVENSITAFYRWLTVIFGPASVNSTQNGRCNSDWAQFSPSQKEAGADGKHLNFLTPSGKVIALNLNITPKWLCHACRTQLHQKFSAIHGQSHPLDQRQRPNELLYCKCCCQRVSTERWPNPGSTSSMVRRFVQLSSRPMTEPNEAVVLRKADKSYAQENYRRTPGWI